MSPPLGLAAEAARRRGTSWTAAGEDGEVGPWCALKLDGAWFPGVADINDPRVITVRIKGDGVGYRIDAQKNKGGDGHHLVVEGYAPKSFTINAKLWRDEQWEAFKAYMPTINPKLKENKRKAYQVQHPVLSAWQIGAIYINNIGFPEDGEHRMVQVVPLTAIEVFDSKKKGKGQTVQPIDINQSQVPLDPKFVIPEGP